MSASDFMTGLINLQKSHDLIGNGQKIYSHAKTFKDSATTCLKTVTADPNNPNALKAIVGIDDKEIKKLLATMATIQKQAGDIIREKFPEVTSGTEAAWFKWYKACVKKGENSSEAQRERKNYIKAIQAYETALEERISYCVAMNNIIDRRIKTYGGVEAVMRSGINIAVSLVSLPEFTDMPHQAAALQIILKFQGVSPAAKRVVKAHKALKPKIKLHQEAKRKLKKANAVWLADMKRTDLTKMIKDALKSVGVEL